jgi:predicted Rossmann fold flavoprotein
MNDKIVIVGGGASGLMLASLLPSGSVIVIDANKTLASKMLISGGGRCNITNAKMGCEYYRADCDFVEYALSLFDNNHVIRWFEDRGLETVVIKNDQYFCKNSAKDIVSILKKEASKQQIFIEEKVLDIKKYQDGFMVFTDKRELKAKAVVVASGGLSFSKLQASDIGYKIASSFGHRIVSTAPALVGLSLQKEQFFFKELSGISCRARISYDGRVFEDDLLFAHKGLSGPVILDISLFWDKGKIEIDFVPNFDWDSIIMHNKKLLSTLLPIPKRLTKAFLIQFDLKDKIPSKYTPKEWELIKAISSYSFAPAGTFGYSKAEATKGGVDTREINPYSMQSYKMDKLYFIGEVLDVTGIVGGYNFQWAFSSAYVCFMDLGV